MTMYDVDNAGRAKCRPARYSVVTVGSGPSWAALYQCIPFSNSGNLSWCGGNRVRVCTSAWFGGREKAPSQLFGPVPTNPYTVTEANMAQRGKLTTVQAS